MAKELKILLRSRKVTKGKIQFTTFSTKMNLLERGKEEEGKKEKWVTLKFTKNVDTSMLKRGYIYVLPENLNAPFIYEIKENADGTKEYPTIWVKRIEKYEEESATHTQSDFVVNDTEETEEDAKELY